MQVWKGCLFIYTVLSIQNGFYRHSANLSDRNSSRLHKLIQNKEAVIFLSYKQGGYKNTFSMLKQILQKLKKYVHQGKNNFYRNIIFDQELIV